MKKNLFTSISLLVVVTGFSFAESTGWYLIDNFQQFHDGQIFLDATDIGWHGSSPEETDEYWMLADPDDPTNIAMFVESGNYGIGYSNVWIQKELPGGGIFPGNSGTLFFRCLWAGIGNNWHVGTADKDLVYDPVTGLQTAPGAWGDFNALIRLGAADQLEHRDGGGYVSTNPPQVVEVYQWYSFWMVVENSWDMSTISPTSTGVYTLYVQGPSFGDGESPTLIPVGTDPPKDKASIRRAPVDEDGNPQAIIWAQFATNSGAPGSPSTGDVFLLDDFYFSPGENLTVPVLNDPSSNLPTPSDVKATLLSGSEVQLTWQDNAVAETGFQVFMKRGFGGDWMEVTDIQEADASGFVVENVDTKEALWFMVKTYSEVAESPFSEIVFAAWNNPILEGATLDQWDLWKLDWFGQYHVFDRNWIYHEELGLFYLDGEDASSFYVYSTLLGCWFWSSQDMYPHIFKFGPYTGWYLYYAGATNDERWFARYSDGTYVRASEINGAVPQPAVPTNLVANIYSPKGVCLVWEDNADYEVGYRIFMQVGDDGEWGNVATVKEQNLTTHTLTDVDTSVPLRFRVQAWKYGSASELSNVALADATHASAEPWILMDNFQQHNAGQVFENATDIGWQASSPSGADQYWIMADPHDPQNSTLFIESGNYGVDRGYVFAQKRIPDDGIAPGAKGTLFFRCLWTGISNSWSIGTIDVELPDQWTYMNVELETWREVLRQRDGESLNTLIPLPRVNLDTWYSFWMVVENSFDMSFTPPLSRGVYTIYVQGPGFGDGVSPTLLAVGTDPPKNKASFRRGPFDEGGNPQSITWVQVKNESGSAHSPNAGDPVLLDDLHFARGVNLTVPGVQ